MRAILEARELAKDDPIIRGWATLVAFNHSIGQNPMLISKENLAKFEALEAEIGGEPGMYGCVRMGGWVA